MLTFEQLEDQKQEILRALRHFLNAEHKFRNVRNDSREWSDLEKQYRYARDMARDVSNFYNETPTQEE